MKIETQSIYRSAIRNNRIDSGFLLHSTSYDSIMMDCFKSKIYKFTLMTPTFEDIMLLMDNLIISPDLKPTIQTSKMTVSELNQLELLIR